MSKLDAMSMVKGSIQLRREAVKACRIRMIAGVLIGPVIVTYAYIIIVNILKIAGLSDVSEMLEKIWQYGGTFINVLIIVMYLYRTNMRKWSYSYMLDYRSRIDSGFMICPRCGSDLKKEKRMRTYTRRIGERITKTTWSNGTVSEKRDPIYGNKSYEYECYVCTNPLCRIETDMTEKLKYRKMPATKKKVCELIIGHP